MIWRRWVTESSSSATQTSSHHRETAGSTTRECVRRKAASFKSASIRQSHWHRHLAVKRPTRRTAAPDAPEVLLWENGRYQFTDIPTDQLANRNVGYPAPSP